MVQLEKNNTMRTITLEEHYATPAFMEGPGRPLKDQAQALQAHPQVAAGLKEVLDRLGDLDNRRIADMDAGGIDMQVLSLTSPGTEQLEATEAVALAREANDLLAEAVRLHPSRLAGFAALPTAAPDTAADELERTVRTYGFKGAVINGHIRGRYLDDPFFWPILERAEALQVPIYLHPTPPPQEVIAASYTGHYAPAVTVALSTAAWGWHIETAIHVLRLILSGAFDRYPRLQVIIGHLGEALPFMLPRLDLALPMQVTKLARPVEAYLRENLSYTFSGFNYLPAFLDLLLQVGVNRIMFSADYPYSSMVQARTFLEQLPVSPADKAQVAHGNAERLLHL
jgi:predicted TIM-barrel fold metal-dependent hydrolase